MKSYFFFGFHIFKYLTVTFMCQLYQSSGINGIRELALKFYFSIRKSIENIISHIIYVVYLK